MKNIEEFKKFAKEWSGEVGLCQHCGTEGEMDDGGHYHGHEGCPNDTSVYIIEVVAEYLNIDGNSYRDLERNNTYLDEFEISALIALKEGCKIESE